MQGLAQRIELLDKLGKYMLSTEESWIAAKDRAVHANAWFTPAHINMAAENIAREYLQKEKLEAWVKSYDLPKVPKRIGITMAGNIPLVGFHDLLCGYITGHQLLIKLSSKDAILIPHLLDKMNEWEPEVKQQIQIAERLNGCDAYIATGSNNTARYFEQYFGKYPHIIRKNRTSVAILDGTETDEELQSLADDIFSYFGLGCRNVTQLCVPEGYDLNNLMQYFKKYEELIHHNKYKNNFDYYLAIYLLNRVSYISNDAVLLIENEIPFSVVSVLHYRYYNNKEQIIRELQKSDDIQTIVGKGFTPFGTSQRPSLSEYADGVDTMTFLCSVK